MLHTISPTVRKLPQQFAQSTETIVLVGGFFILVFFLAATIFETIHEKNFPSLTLKPNNNTSVLGTNQQATPSATPTVRVTTAVQKVSTASGLAKQRITITPTKTLLVSPTIKFTSTVTPTTIPSKSKTGTIQSETLSVPDTATASGNNISSLSPLMSKTITNTTLLFQQNFGL